MTLKLPAPRQGLDADNSSTNLAQGAFHSVGRMFDLALAGAMDIIRGLRSHYLASHNANTPESPSSPPPALKTGSRESIEAGYFTQNFRCYELADGFAAIVAAFPAVDFKLDTVGCGLEVRGPRSDFRRAVNALYDLQEAQLGLKVDRSCRDAVRMDE